MRVPFNDLSRSLSEQRQALDSAFSAVLDSGQLVQGPECQAFERELANFLGASHVVGVASGTDALELAMRAAQSDHRKTVVTVANAGGYSSTAALAAGYKIRYVDVNPATHCLAPDHLQLVLEDEDVFAVVATHLYGRMAPMGEVTALCRRRGVVVIEDCAQAIGASLDGRMAGSWGEFAAFSFYPTKNLGALGDGGAIAVHRPEDALRVRRLAQYGWSSKYVQVMHGGRNSRLDELQAAFLRRRLPGVLSGNARRRDIVEAYREAAPSAVRVLPALWGHSAHLAVVETRDATALAAWLKGRGVESAVHYPIADHRQPTAPRAGVSLPATDALTGSILSLPCFPEMSDSEVQYVCRVLAAYREEGAV